MPSHTPVATQLELDQLWADVVTAAATERDRQCSGYASYRPLSEGYSLVGFMGEAAFAREFHQPLDLQIRPEGDGGVDFVVPLRFTIDVKTSRKAYSLVAEEGKVSADIYVLAQFIEDPVGATLLGWEWGRILRQAPTCDFGTGVITHRIPRERLRPMHELQGRMMRLG